MTVHSSGLKKRRLILGRRIGHPPPLHPGKRGKTMQLHLSERENMANRKPSGRKRVGEKQPMTSPRNRLGAHQCDPLSRRPGEKGIQPLLKTLRLHVIGVSPEARIPPALIWRTRVVAFTKSAERRLMTIFHLMSWQQRRQMLFIKMRDAARFRHRPDIDQTLDPIMRQQRK